VTRSLLQPVLDADAKFASNSNRVAARVEMKSVIEGTFGALRSGEVVALLDAAGIANARMNDIREVWKHPQLAARGPWTEVDTPAGKVPALLPPALPADVVPRMDPVPALGEHTERIPGELGYPANSDTCGPLLTSCAQPCAVARRHEDDGRTGSGSIFQEADLHHLDVMLGVSPCHIVYADLL
jgi:crotonobetainyl-CoA:carnitine CoA-transferase CaiB-like acyl-CoA transferase